MGGPGSGRKKGSGGGKSKGKKGMAKVDPKFNGNDPRGNFKNKKEYNRAKKIAMKGGGLP